MPDIWFDYDTSTATSTTINWGQYYTSTGTRYVVGNKGVTEEKKRFDTCNHDFDKHSCYKCGKCVLCNCEHYKSQREIEEFENKKLCDSALHHFAPKKTSG